jgi:hypothetical protein
VLFMKSGMSAINRAKAKAEEQAGVVRTLARSVSPLRGDPRRQPKNETKLADVVADV